MRSRIGIALASLLAGSAAFAQQAPQPLDPYGTYQYAPPPPPPAAAGSVTINIQQAPASTQQIAPAQPQPYAPMQPYAPPPQQRYYGQPGYYYPPPGYSAPVYQYPPPGYSRYPQRPMVRRYTPAPRTLSCGGCRWSSPTTNTARPRFFSIGARFSAIGINQEINGQDVALGGMGLQLRFRTRGRFGIEAGLDFLKGEFKAGGAEGSTTPSPSGAPPNGATGTPGTFHVGDVTRESVPFTLSALVYIFPNDDARIFNLYFLGGVGVIGTRMSLLNQNGERVNQDFTEYSAHLGIGAELRFRWFAIDSSIRALGLSRDDSEAPATYYTGVEGAPVPKSSAGYQGTLAATIWF